MLSEKSLRILLVVSAALVSGYFSVKAASAILTNHSLKQQVPAVISQWEVKELRSDRYAVEARYYLDLGGQRYSGATQFSDAYLNSFSAIASLKEMAKQEWMAWIDPVNPACSTLEKAPSTGLAMRALVSLMVFFYFACTLYKKYFNLDRVDDN